MKKTRTLEGVVIETALRQERDLDARSSRFSNIQWAEFGAKTALLELRRRVRKLNRSVVISAIDRGEESVRLNDVLNLLRWK